MKALIVSQYFWPETFRINDVALSLANNNCEVEVLTGQPNYPEGRLFPGYRMCGLQVEQFHSLKVKRVPLLPRGSGAVRLALNYISFILSACLFGPFQLRRKPFDVVFVYGISPILAALPALLIGWLKGAPVVIWVQDLWPESLSATGYVKKKWVLYAVEQIVRFIYARADLLLVQSLAFIDDVKPLAGSTPVVYYPNSVEDSFSQPVQRGDIPLPDLTEKFIVLFAGNIGKAQAIETIIEAAERLKAHPDIHFVLVGDGRMRSWAQDEIAARNLTNVSLPGKFPIERMPAYMNQASALLVTLKDEAIFAKTVPNKVQAYLAVGRPIIAALNGEGARVVTEAGAGIAAGVENAESLANVCLSLFRMTNEERSRMGEQGRSYFFDHYNHDNLIEDLITHFQTVMKKRL